MSVTATIVLDVGSTFLKSALADPNTARLSDRRSSRLPDPLPALPGRHELDPLLVHDHVVSQLRHHLAQGIPIARIAVSTQMHSFLLCDRQGRPVTPIITWQDRRAAAVTGSRTEGTVSAAVLHHYRQGHRSRCGVPLRPGLPLDALAHWIDEHGPVRDLEFHTLGSYLIRQLTGVHATHLTNAAATAMVDLSTGDWDRATIGAVVGDGLTLPRIVNGPVGGWRPPDHCHAIEVWSDIGDLQATLYGIGARPGDTLVSLGTAGLVSQAVDRSSPRRQLERRPYRPGQELDTITGLPGGRQLQEWIDRHRSGTDDAAWTGLAAELPQDLTAEFSSAYQRALADLQVPESGNRVIFAGGVATRTPTLVDLLSKDLRPDLVTVADPDAPLTGLARWAATPTSSRRAEP